MSDSRKKIFVRRLESSPGEEVIKRATEIACEAFKGDVFTDIILCDQLSLAPDCNEAQIRAGLFAGQVWVAGFTPDDIQGVAVWFGPGQEFLGGFNGEEQMKLGWESFQAKLPKDGMRGWWTAFFGEYDRLTTESLCVKYNAPNWRLDSWNLIMLVITPEHQRKGLGAALIETVREKAEKQKVGLSVETETEKALLFYKSLGFVEEGCVTVIGYTEGAKASKTCPMWCLAMHAA